MKTKPRVFESGKSVKLHLWHYIYSVLNTVDQVTYISTVLLQSVNLASKALYTPNIISFRLFQ